MINAEDRQGARQRDVDVRPHRRRPDRQAPQAAQEGDEAARPHADAARGAAGRRRTSTTTPPPTTPASRSRSPAPRRSTTARSSPTAARGRARHDGDGRVDGAVVEADGRRSRCAARAVVNAAGVWSDDVRAPRRGRRPRHDPARQGHPHHVPWEKVRNDIAVVIPVPEGQAQRVRRAVGPSARRHVRAHLHRHHRHRLRRPIDDPQCTADDLDYVLRALNLSVRRRR